MGVLYGIKAASYLSYIYKYISKSDYERIINMINIFKLNKLKNLDKNKILELIDNDKKNINNRLNYVLLKSIGGAIIKNNFKKENIRMALDIL